MRSIQDRLLDKVMYEPNTGCWYWTACLNEHGYGILAIKDRRYQLSHRVSYEVFKGKITPGLFVCHSCDNPACVNPDHLFLGSHMDNMRDMYKKGRRSNFHVVGGNNPKAKLTSKDVLEIKNTGRGRGVAPALARKYAVSKATIYGVWSGSQWSHINLN